MTKYPEKSVRTNKKDFTFDLGNIDHNISRDKFLNKSRLANHTLIINSITSKKNKTNFSFQKPEKKSLTKDEFAFCVNPEKLENEGVLLQPISSQEQKDPLNKATICVNNLVLSK